MRIQNLVTTYHDMLKDSLSFPPQSPAKALFKKKMKTWLKGIRDQYGQEIVTEITGKHPQNDKIIHKLIV